MTDEPPPDRCGTHYGYRDHERDGTEKCAPCTVAQRLWQRDYEKRRYLNRGPLLVDGTGTRRRMRALTAIGWPRRLLAEHIGTAVSYTGALAFVDRVQASTARRVAEVYDELSMTLGPSVRSVNSARGKGWLPPLAWDDETIDDPEYVPEMAHIRPRTISADKVAIHRAMRGQPPARLTRAERLEAVRRLTDQQFPSSEIADRLGVSQRQVSRDRADLTRSANGVRRSA